MTVVQFDFRGAPPAQGGGNDHIPPGQYRMQLVEVEDGMSTTHKRMLKTRIVVSAGEHKGARLSDNFVLEGENKFGVQRLHAFFLAIGLPVKEAAFKLDLEVLKGKECLGDVYDDEYTPNNGATRTVSKVNAYYPISKAAPAAKAPAATAPAATAPVAAAPEEPAPIADDASDLLEIAASEPAGAAPATVEEEVNDLFA